MISYLAMGKKLLILMTVILLIGSVYLLLQQGQRSAIIEPEEIDLRTRIINEFKDQLPREWGLNITGVKTRLNTKSKVIALTFDACGGKHGGGFDRKLIFFLMKHKILATLFISGKWIAQNPLLFKQLAANPLFEIENHGLNHLPCSVNGQSAYAIKGTNNIEEVIKEIDLNEKKIEALTGRRPKFYRSGTAHYDEIAVKIANQLGYEVVNFSINGDLGATASRQQLVHNLSGAKAGSIIIMHMNHPEGETAEGVIAAVPILKHKGFSFAKLSDYPLK